MNTGVIRKTSGQGFVNVPSRGDLYVVVKIVSKGETDFYRSDDKARAIQVLNQLRLRFGECKWRLDKLTRSRNVEHDEKDAVDHKLG